MKGGEEIEKGARSTVKDESLREQKKKHLKGQKSPIAKNIDNRLYTGF